MFRLSLALAIVFMLVAPGVPWAQDQAQSAKSRPTQARGAVKNRQTSTQRRGYRAETAARTCGEFMYWKGGKCNDARNK